MEKEILKDKRREFIITSGKLAGLGICTCLFGSIIAACDKDGETVTAPEQPKPENYPVLSIASFAALASVGGIVKTMVMDKTGKPVNGGNPLIIYRMETNKFIVLDSICRHAGYQVDIPSSPSGDYVCPAHKAEFDTADGHTTTNGSAGTTVPPLLKYNSIYDSAENKLTIAI